MFFPVAPVLLVASLVVAVASQASPDSSGGQQSEPAAGFSYEIDLSLVVPAPATDAAVLPRISALRQSTPKFNRHIILDGRPGDREEIGLFTEWQSELLATGANRELTLRQADSMLDAPWCDYEVMRLAPWNGGEYAISFAHVPNLFFLPYLLTGDSKYVLPMECQFRLLQEWPQKSSGSEPVPLLGNDGKRPMYWLTGRDYAWSLRNLVQLAYIEKRGDTQQKIYVQALENTRKAAFARMKLPIESEFHVLGENRNSGVEQWSGWFEGFIGMTVNHAINLGFEEWRPVAEWHFKHLQWRCGEKWPVKACDVDHVDVRAGGTWADTPPYNAARMDCYLAAPDDELMRTKCGSIFMTYDDRAQIARSWAAMAAASGVEGARQVYKRLDALIRKRGGTSWYKYAILP